MNISQQIKSSKKISIVGCSGSGKSTLSIYLSKQLELPCYHIDTLFWKPEWVQSSQDEIRKKLKPILASSKWILDGTFDSTFDLRLPQTDLFIIINLSRWACLHRVIKRLFKYSKKNRRPDMPEGCDESFDFKFYKYIWNYNRDTLPIVLKAVEQYDLQDRFVHLKTQSEIDEFKTAVKQTSL